MTDYRLSANRSLLIMAFTSSGVMGSGGCENILDLTLNLKVKLHLVFQFFMSATFSQTCICNCVFTDISAFSQHEKGCKKGKKCLLSALDRAKEVYQRKRTRMSCGGKLGGQFGTVPRDLSTLGCHALLTTLVLI